MWMGPEGGELKSVGMKGTDTAWTLTVPNGPAGHAQKREKKINAHCMIDWEGSGRMSGNTGVTGGGVVLEAV